MELPDRDDRDDEAAAILALLLAQFRAELLKTWRDGRREPPDDYWPKFAQDFGDQLAVLLFGVFLASVRFHSGGSELDQRAIDAGLPWAAERARWLAGLITTTSRGWLTLLLADIAAGTLNDDEIGARLDKIFGVKRAGLVAMQAVTYGQTAGGEFAMRTLGVISMEDVWVTHPELSQTGPCPICGPLDGTPRSHWEIIFPHGPPEPHITCVCSIRYSHSP